MVKYRNGNNLFFLYINIDKVRMWTIYCILILSKKNGQMR